MKHLIIFFVCMICTAPLLMGIEALPVIENPDGLTHPNAGRIVKLTEVMRISGEHDNFFFKRPSNIKIAPDGSIFLIDDKQFLRFDKNGRFLGNLHKIGEGPGETTYVWDYFFSKKGILIFSGQPRKIIETDLAGNLLREQRIESKTGITKNLGIYNDKYWIAFSGLGDVGENMKGIVDVKLQLGWRTLDGIANDTNLIFIEKIYLNQRKIGNATQRIMSNLVPAIFALAPDGNLFVSDSQEYSIKQVSLDKEKIVREFKRKYPRVPYTDETEEEGRKRKSVVPSPKFFNDILKLLCHRENLWVLTSSIDKRKGILVDIFSRDGHYIDCFYLPIPQVDTIRDLKLKTIALSNDYLFTVEKDEDENPFLVKYVLAL